jgi:hypothetical protein
MLWYNALVNQSGDGEQRRAVTTFVMGTRWDHAPQPHPDVLFTRICEVCKQTTYTEVEHPHDSPVVCNVCSSQISAQGEIDPNAEVVWDLPPDFLGRLLATAEERGITPTEYIKGFLEWKLGRAIPEVLLYNRVDKKIYKMG